MAFCGRDVVVYTVLTGLVLTGAFSPPVIAEPVVAATDPYVEAVAEAGALDRLGGRSQGVAGSVDRADRRSADRVGSGIRLRRFEAPGTGHGRYGLPGWVGIRVAHRSCGHAARRTGPTRPRCARQSLLARIQSAKPVQRPDHVAAIDVTSLGTGAGAARGPLLRSGATEVD